MQTMKNTKTKAVKTAVARKLKQPSYDLIPPDYDRCQTEWKAVSFMTLGPRQMVRCPAVPTHIATEIEPDEYGRRGSMSLCDAHREAIQEQMPGKCAFEPITSTLRKGKGRAAR